jgi:hypothetical protein
MRGKIERQGRFAARGRPGDDDDLVLDRQHCVLRDARCAGSSELVPAKAGNEGLSLCHQNSSSW